MFIYDKSRYSHQMVMQWCGPHWWCTLQGRQHDLKPARATARASTTPIREVWSSFCADCLGGRNLWFPQKLIDLAIVFLRMYINKNSAQRKKTCQPKIHDTNWTRAPKKAGDQSYTWAPLSREIRIRSGCPAILSSDLLIGMNISHPSPGRLVGTASGFLGDSPSGVGAGPRKPHGESGSLQATTTSLRQRRQHRLLGPKKGLAVGHWGRTFFGRFCGDFAEKNSSIC